MKFRRLLCSLCLLLLTTCRAEPRQGVGGTLYLEDSIAGGLRITWLFLADDGTFVRDPQFGVDPLNYAKEKEAAPANTGTYVKSGNMISVTFANGNKEQWPMEYLNGKLNTINGLFASVQSPMAAGFKLEGSFAQSFGFRDTAISRTYIFGSNGSVVYKGKSTMHSSVLGASADGSAEERGSYKVTGNTLFLDFDSGEHFAAVIGLLPGDKPSIIINGGIFK